MAEDTKNNDTDDTTEAADQEDGDKQVVSSEGSGAPKRRKVNKSPDGQTASGSGELGGDPEADFENPVTRPGDLGVTKATKVKKKDSDGDDDGATPKLFVQLTKALGLKEADLLSYNEKTRVAVYSNGGKYQVSKNGKSVRHHSGPPPPADIKLNVIDARSRAPFIGTAAAINAPAAVMDTDPNALRDRRAALRDELAQLDEQLGDDAEEE